MLCQSEGIYQPAFRRTICVLVCMSLSLHEFRVYVKIIFYSLHAPLLALLQFSDIAFILC